MEAASIRSGHIDQGPDGLWATYPLVLQDALKCRAQVVCAGQDAHPHQGEPAAQVSTRAPALSSGRQRPTDMAGAAAEENRGKLARGARYGFRLSGRQAPATLSYHDSGRQGPF